MSKHRTARSERRSNTRKIMISLGVVGAAAAVAGMGTFGTFTSTTSGSQSVASGTVNIALGGNGGANDLSIAATNIVPGDTIQRAVTVSNTGTADLGGVTLSTTASPSSALNTDKTNGLQLDIKSCPSAWAKGGSPTAPTYSCTNATPVVASTPVIAANLTTAGVLPAGANANLLLTLTLPTTAGNEFQGLASTVTFTFTGTQRAATNR